MYKRVFTKNDINLNYQDYNKLISGIETLKTIKREDNLAVLKQFGSYQSWQTLNISYFPFINNNSVEITYIKNIFDANESFIEKTCDTDILEKKDLCKSNMNTLYPYGKIVSKKIVNPQFPTNIYLCRWCNNKPKANENVTYIRDDLCNKCCKKYSKRCSLCKNAKQLFI